MWGDDLVVRVDLKLILQKLRRLREWSEKRDVEARCCLALKVTLAVGSGELYTPASPSITAGLSDPAHFNFGPVFLSCSPSQLSFTHMFPFFSTSAVFFVSKETFEAFICCGSTLKNHIQTTTANQFNWLNFRDHINASSQQRKESRGRHVVQHKVHTSTKRSSKKIKTKC